MNTMRSLKIIFAGTSDFAVPILQGILNNSPHEVCAVLSQPDRPAGRGQRIQWSPIKQFACQHNLTLYQPPSLDSDILQSLERLSADIIIVVAYGLILPKALLSMTKGGCINVHASLLPRWRGAAPIQHALLSGDACTGITIMQMDEGLDTGPILNQESVSIKPEDTSLVLFSVLSLLGRDLLLSTLKSYCLGQLSPYDQRADLVTHAPKITKSQAQLDWRQNAKKLHQRVRAFNPWPIAYSDLGGLRIRLWQTAVLPGQFVEPGKIIDVSKKGIDVATGDGVLRIMVGQLPSKKPQTALSLLNAYKELFKPGQCFK